MREVFACLADLLQRGEPVVLAAVIGESGSAPRGSGAMLLAGREGRLAGTIGGGAVEKRSVELAVSLLEEERSETRTFALRQKPGEDIGMLCGGEVCVRFQYITPAVPEWEALVRRFLQETGSAGWLLLPLKDGPPALLDGGGTCLAGRAPENMEGLLKRECVRTDAWFSMPLAPQVRAVIFGGGHIAAELVPLLSRLDFRVTVFDDRPEYAGRDRFPTADEVLCGDYGAWGDQLRLDREDYVVVITEGHRHDFEVERQVLRNPPAYLGVIGSRTKTAAVNEKLRACGFREETLRQIHTPIGMAIRAETPAEIAVSIAGEMILVRAERRGAGLKTGCPMS